MNSTIAHFGALQHAAHQSAAPSLHETYFLDVPRAPSAKALSVVRFDGVEAIGEARRFAITLTHPLPDLPRTDYLNRSAAFTIQPPGLPGLATPNSAGRKIQGVVTGFNQLASNRDQTTYEVILESRLALLRNTPKCRFLLNLSFPKIIEQILREHGFDAIQASFDFKLYRQYEQREFVMQWHESDLAFITRLCRRSGIWFVQEEGEHCEVVRFGDDLTHYRRKPGLTIPFRAKGGLTNTGAESIESIETRHADDSRTTVGARLQLPCRAAAGRRRERHPGRRHHLRADVRMGFATPDEKRSRRSPKRNCGARRRWLNRSSIAVRGM